jgi:hypothetical protein
MKLDPRYKIEKVACKNDDRPNLHCVYLDTDGAPAVPGSGDRTLAGKLVATDGRAMAVVPCHVEHDETPGPLPVEAAKAARSCSLGATAAPDEVLEHLTGNKLTRNKNVDFPPWRMVVPAPSDDDFIVGIDAKLLLELADAIGAENRATKQRIVKLRIPRSGVDPITVEPNNNLDGSYGLIMPCRV